MKEQTIKEIIRRWEILLDNAQPDEIETGMSGSLSRFRSSLALIGYPYGDPPEWMDEEYVKPAMTTEEFDSSDYDDFIKTLFEIAYHKVNDLVENMDQEIEKFKQTPNEYVKRFHENCAAQYREWMKDFQDPPKPTREELQSKIKYRSNRLIALKRLNAPSLLMEHEQNILGGHMSDLQEGRWAVTTAEIAYNEQWHAREDSFQPVKFKNVHNEQ